MKRKTKNKFRNTDGVGDSQNISPIPPAHMRHVTKYRCDACEIGIGKSMIYEKKMWREHTHINKTINKIGDNIYCDDCYEEIMKKKRRKKFMEKK